MHSAPAASHVRFRPPGVSKPVCVSAYSLVVHSFVPPHGVAGIGPASGKRKGGGFDQPRSFAHHGDENDHKRASLAGQTRTFLSAAVRHTGLATLAVNVDSLKTALAPPDH